MANQSPLEAIKQAEIEAARRIADAHTQAEQMIADANTQAEWLVEQAERKGQEDGQALVEDILNRTRKDTQARTAMAEERATTLYKHTASISEKLIQTTISVVLGDEEA